MTDYPCPGGGCLLTYEGFAAKVRDLLDRGEGLNPWNVALLRVGRHFRLPEGTKLVVGKQEERKNERLAGLAKDGAVVLESVSAPGPTALAYCLLTPDDLRAAAGVVARYADRQAEGMPCVVACRCVGGEETEDLRVEPLPAEMVAGWMIGQAERKREKAERSVRPV